MRIHRHNEKEVDNLEHPLVKMKKMFYIYYSLSQANPSPGKT